MAFSRRFEVGLVLRAALLLAALLVLIAALRQPGLVAGRLVALLIAGGVIAELWQFIRRTNIELARFVEAVGFGDYTQRFAAPAGSGFDSLGEALDRAMRSLGAQRTVAAEEARYLGAVLDDAPVALLAIDDDGSVELLNKAARRQFARFALTHVDDFARYGGELAAAAALPPGRRRLTRIVLDGVATRVLFATARLDRLGGGRTIASVLPVQHELGAAEFAAQADLVRVLTHEIMNSLTPVTSLARSSAELVAAAAARDPSLADARDATATLTNRADGILRFVESYREFARTLEPARRRFAARPWADEIALLAAADPKSAGIAPAITVEPAGLVVDGDADMLAQVALNLVRNAALATAGQVERRVALRVAATPDGHVLIEVADNGPGIAANRRDDVFLPFYTTRAGGSGVGLSFARQVVLAHGGTIAADAAPGGGALIRIAL